MNNITDKFERMKQVTDHFQNKFTRIYSETDIVLKKYPEIHDLHSLNVCLEKEGYAGWNEINEYEDKDTYEFVLREVEYYREHGAAKRIVMGH